MQLPSELLKKLVERAVKQAFPELQDIQVTIEPARDLRHGDYATPIAMKLAPQLKRAPTEIAQHLLAVVGTAPMLAKAEVAPPGFMNFFIKPEWMMKQVEKILADKEFGQNNSGQGQKLIVEYISANPTGPMTLGNGRGAFGGDALANVMAMNGWRVTREYYINDIGNQVNILAESVIRRYFQSHGKPTEYPDYCYQGEYVNELAKKMKLDTMKLQDMMTIRDRIKGRVLETMIRDIQRVVEKKLKIGFDSWFRESALYEKKLDEKALKKLRDHDFVYERDGALWFRTTAFLDDKDRVLIKKNGDKTYFVSDIALRYYRFLVKGFEREILFLGADHHGYESRLQSAMAALGVARRLDIQLVQLVRLLRNGQEVKMSKRAGTYVTLEEVVDEVGLDVARFFFLMHSAHTHMDFDLNLAKEKSEKNPVFYVQYAGARMWSILKKAKGLPVSRTEAAIHPKETALVKLLLQFPIVIREVGASYETQKLPFFAIELATAFHDFYMHCRVIDTNSVDPQRLRLIEATLFVLRKTLATMGVSAPERM